MPFQLSYNNQQFANPMFTEDEFSKFQGLDMNFMANQANRADTIANQRLDSMIKERDAFLEKTKLNKRFSDLEQQYLNSLNSVIDNSSKVQLSDNANFVKLNTEITKLKNDPILKDALYTTEQAKKYQEYKEANPYIIDQPWNDTENNNKRYQDFIEGRTNTFDFKPMYKEFDYNSKVEDFIKGLKPDEIEAFKNKGFAGIYQEKDSSLTYKNIIDKTDKLKQFLLNQDPEGSSYFKRVNDYFTTKGESNKAEKLIMNSIEMNANKYAKSKLELSNYQVDPNQKFKLEQNADARAWREDSRQQQQFNAQMNGTWNPSGKTGGTNYNQLNNKEVLSFRPDGSFNEYFIPGVKGKTKEESEKDISDRIAYFVKSHKLSDVGKQTGNKNILANGKKYRIAGIKPDGSMDIFVTPTVDGPEKMVSIHSSLVSKIFEGAIIDNGNEVNTNSSTTMSNEDLLNKYK